MSNKPYTAREVRLMRERDEALSRAEDAEAERDETREEAMARRLEAESCRCAARDEGVNDRMIEAVSDMARERDEARHDVVRLTEALAAALVERGEIAAEVDQLRAALLDAARSLTALSTAGARNGDPGLADLIDVRGYATSRAKVAWGALARVAAAAPETAPAWAAIAERALSACSTCGGCGCRHDDECPDCGGTGRGGIDAGDTHDRG